MLVEFPTVRIGRPQDGKGNAFGHAIWSSPENVAQDALALAREAGSDAVLVIEADIVPEAAAEAISVDPIFLGQQYGIGFVALVSVTGLFADCGAKLVPTACDDFEAELRNPAITFPFSIGAFLGHDTPEAAFRNGYITSSRNKAMFPTEKEQLALSASLGTDAMNGDWWVLGALSGLMAEKSVANAWLTFEWLLSEPRDIPRQIDVLARKVREHTEIPVLAATQGESRALKAILPTVPDVRFWDGFARGCSGLGRETALAAVRMRKAAFNIWPEMTSAG